MFVEKVKTKTKNKTYDCFLLRETYRENGKVRHRTIANISSCSIKQIEAIKFALQHKDEIDTMFSVSKDVALKQGLSVGAVWTLYQMAKRLGIDKAIGDSREGKLALWQVIARLIDQGSRLSAVRLCESHAACDILDINESFNENDLYADLAWICENQQRIENNLFRLRFSQSRKPDLYLYDVTSSYLEGDENELAAFGYNRDKKKGKKQIVIGLLCDADGVPVSIEVFQGNTTDPQTFVSQVKKLADRFGCKNVTMVGDRGMIKTAQIESLDEENFHYITAITKPQIETLIKNNIIRLELFDKDVAEVEDKEDNGKPVRYILRQNPLRKMEIEEIRKDKIQTIKKYTDSQNKYLKEHPKARQEAAISRIQEKIEKLKIEDWTKINLKQEEIIMEEDSEKLEEISKLDGCYVIKTDIQKESEAKENIHARYKDLTKVEEAFRTIKTTHLEVRPVYVRTEENTRGHVLVMMMAYMIAGELRRSWKEIDITVEEGIKGLDAISSTEIYIKGERSCQKIPRPSGKIEKILKAVKIELPEMIPSKGINVTSKRKLPERRK